MRAALLAALLAGCAQSTVPSATPALANPAHPVHPRQFDAPGSVGVTRGWYVWHSFDPETWRAEVSSEPSGKRFTTRVLPWVTSYRHLAYPGHPDELLPGERVNLFFNPEGGDARAYLVHIQDEMGQMKGHGQFWFVEEVKEGGREFVARVNSAEKPIDAKPSEFELDPACIVWRNRRKGVDAGLAPGDRLYLTWCYEGTRRVVKVLVEGDSLEGLKAEAVARATARVKREGLAGIVESVGGGKANVLIFSTYWAQAAELKADQIVSIQPTDPACRVNGLGVEGRIGSQRNMGTYGSGPTEMVVLDVPPDLMTSWVGGRVVRVFPR